MAETQELMAKLMELLTQNTQRSRAHSPSPNGPCYHCNEPGHTAHNCPKPRSLSPSPSRESTPHPRGGVGEVPKWWGPSEQIWTWAEGWSQWSPFMVWHLCGWGARGPCMIRYPHGKGQSSWARVRPGKVPTWSMTDSLWADRITDTTENIIFQQLRWWTVKRSQIIFSAQDNGLEYQLHKV